MLEESSTTEKAKNMQDNKSTSRNRITQLQAQQAAIWASQQTEPMELQQWLDALNRRFTDAKSGTFSSRRQVMSCLEAAGKEDLLIERKKDDYVGRSRKLRGLASIVRRLVENNGLEIPDEDMLVLQMMSKGSKYETPEEIRERLEGMKRAADEERSMFSADD